MNKKRERYQGCQGNLGKLRHIRVVEESHAQNKTILRMFGRRRSPDEGSQGREAPGREVPGQRSAGRRGSSGGGTPGKDIPGRGGSRAKNVLGRRKSPDEEVSGGEGLRVEKI